MAGWISLHRKIMDNPIYSNAFMLKLWIHCLMKATHKEHSQLIGNQMVKLLPGQFITGRFSLAEEFNKGAKSDEVISDRTLWRWIKNFEEWQMLSIKSTTKYSVITISNWTEHQQHDQQMSSKCPTDVQQVSTNNNDNNVNKINKEDDKGPSNEINPFQFYEQEGFGTISSFIAEQLGDLIDDFGEEKVIQAMKETRLNGSTSLNYTRKILTNPKQKREKGDNHATIKQGTAGDDEKQSRISAANERRKRIAGIKSD